MEYVDLGVMEKSRRKKGRVLGKRVASKHPKDSFSHGKKIIVISAAVGLFLFGAYSYLPQLKSIWYSLLKGPSVVMSFLKNDPGRLKQDDGITNVLLIGIDKRSYEPYSYQGAGGEETKNGFLADTIIVASYSHTDHSVVMLSLPRDLWVEIPAFNNDVYKQSTKINAAYSIGDMYGYEGGGLALTKRIASEILGIPIHYSARIDFEGFVKGIDLLGGVDIEIENTFDDWMYPREGYENAPLEQRYIHLHFDEGWQHMNGETALRFARSRQGTNGEGSDFARAKRQQKVILAVKDKVYNLNLFDSLSKLSGLIDTFGESIQTDMEPSEMLLGYKIGRDLDISQVKTRVLDTIDEEAGLLYHPPLEQFGGAWVLLPKGGNWDLVQEFAHRIFYTERTTVQPYPNFTRRQR